MLESRGDVLFLLSSLLTYFKTKYLFESKEGRKMRINNKAWFGDEILPRSH